MSFYLRLSYVVFLAFLIGSTLWFQLGHAPVSAILIMLAIQTLPLLIFAYAVWQEKGNGLLTLTLILLGYMGYATMNCFAHGLTQLLAIIELFLALWLMVMCSKVVKRQPRGQGAL